jgi:hypothetical protein
MFAELPMFTCFTHANTHWNVKFIFFITPFTCIKYVNVVTLIVMLVLRYSFFKRACKRSLGASGIPRNIVWGGVSAYSVEDGGQREQGSGGGSPLVSGSGGSCNLVKEISFQIVKFS